MARIAVIAVIARDRKSKGRGLMVGTQPGRLRPSKAKIGRAADPAAVPHEPGEAEHNRSGATESERSSHGHSKDDFHIFRRAGHDLEITAERSRSRDEPDSFIAG